ncbi:hypothetical protein ACMD2_15180 [Ananas comosus]|uniref:Magnesium transporter CorA-like family protein n=1 Tax=Ananas comosus TaxID=4615 RepID=A0A199VH99_ANACO|nr:hypothetical protein ACMD2_15180 [Ananas comosus]
MDGQSPPCHSKSKKQEIKDGAPRSDLWTDGLICAFEFVRCNTWTSPNSSRVQSMQVKDNLNPKKQGTRCRPGSVSPENLNKHNSVHSLDLPVIDDEVPQSEDFKANSKYATNSSESHWMPIGWTRISELVQMVQTDATWDSERIDLIEDGDDFTVADVAAPYWVRPAGPTWWCHVAAGNKSVDEWLSNAHWLHPAISIALRDESRLISEKMKHLLYEVPVRVAGGLLFELLGQSVGDPSRNEDDIPIVLRSWQAQNFLITALHVKGSASNINVLGITEVQELLFAGGSAAPKSIHEVIAHLACRLARWDDRLFRKYVFGAADEIELKFVNRRNHEDLNLLSTIFNQEIRRLATQVIRVKWSLHAREEIIFELLRHLRGNATKAMLEGMKKNTREMLQEQEAVRGRLFTIQDVMQSTVRAWLQDKSLHITHNLTIFGGCGLVLSIITGLFGINVDGIPGAENTPYAFSLFTGLLFSIGIVLIVVGMLYFGLKKPITEEQVQVRKLELQQLVSMFQREAENHAKVREGVSQHHLLPSASDIISDAERGYLLIP